MKIVSFLFVAALLVGCASTSVISSGGADTAIPVRPPGATYPNWEYICVAIEGGTTKGRSEELLKAFRRAGDEGWELVSVGAVSCFKRPAVAASAADDPTPQ